MARRSSKQLNEWELLCVEEDIEVGDTLRVELYQQIVDMILVEVGNGYVTLVDRDGTRRMFKTTTLEGFGGPGYIIGKSTTQLRISDLGK